MKVMMPCSVELTKLLVADLLILVKMGLPKGTGSSPMELEFLVQLASWTSTEPEARWMYVCNAKEVERRGPTAVRYLMQ